MNKFVTIVYENCEIETLEGSHTEYYVVDVYENPDDADQDYPWNYKETKYLNTSARTQTPEKGNNGDNSPS